MNLKQKLVLLLSEPGYSDNEFRDVSLWLERGGLAKCLRDAEEIRIKLRSYQDRTVDKNLRARVTDDGLLSQIDRLLRQEGNMTAHAALELLKERTSFGGNLPDKISFAEGIQRILKEIDASNILAISHQIRNERAHQTTSPTWPLNRD